jgi:hypothetical protein
LSVGNFTLKSARGSFWQVRDARTFDISRLVILQPALLALLEGFLNFGDSFYSS